MRLFQTQKNGDLGGTALHVTEKMTGNINFVDKSIDPAALGLAANAFIKQVAVCKDGTRQDTILEQQLKVALIAMLNKFADFVEANSNNDPVIMASSGFPLASLDRVSPAPVGTGSIAAVTNPDGGCLNLVVTCGPNVWGVEVQYYITPGVWLPGGYFTDLSDITPAGLPPCTVLGLRVRLHGSYNQTSPWSDVVTHTVM